MNSDLKLEKVKNDAIKKVKKGELVTIENFKAEDPIEEIFKGVATKGCIFERNQAPFIQYHLNKWGTLCAIVPFTKDIATLVYNCSYLLQIYL